MALYLLLHKILQGTELLWFGSGMSTKGPWIKGLVLSLVLLGGGRKFKKWGLVGGFLTLEACT